MKKDAASAQAGKGSSVDYAAENARLRAENLELRRVNELLKEASAFFRIRTRPSMPGNDRVHRPVSRSFRGACSSVVLWPNTA